MVCETPSHFVLKLKKVFVKVRIVDKRKRILKNECERVSTKHYCSVIQQVNGLASSHSVFSTAPFRATLVSCHDQHNRRPGKSVSSSGTVRLVGCVGEVYEFC
jgi:hypothetical protein